VKAEIADLEETLRHVLGQLQDNGVERDPSIPETEALTRQV
jgi:hypothetical protein